MEWEHAVVVAAWVGFGYLFAAAVGWMTRTPDDDIRVLPPAEVADLLIRELEEDASKHYPTPN